MCRLKYSLPCGKVNITARCNTNTSYLCSKCIGDIVSIEIKCCNDIILISPCQYLLKKCICNSILNQYLSGRDIPFALIPGNGLIAELLLCKLIPPPHKCTFCKLHDITFMNKGNALSVIIDSIINCSPYQTLCPFTTDRFYTYARCLRESYLLHTHLGLKIVDYLLNFRGSSLPLNPCIYILSIFPENYHVNKFRVLYRRWGTKPYNRSQTYIKVKYLSQCNIQAPDTLAYRGCKRPFYSNYVFLNCLNSIVGEKIRRAVCTVMFLRTLPCENLKPFNLSLTLISLLYCCIHNPDRCSPYIRPCAVPSDKGYNRIIWNI